MVPALPSGMPKRFRNCHNAPFPLAYSTNFSVLILLLLPRWITGFRYTAGKTSYFLNTIWFVSNPARWISRISFWQQYMKFFSRYFLSFIFFVWFLGLLSMKSWGSFQFILFIYLWLHWVFIGARGLSLVAVSRGYSSLKCAASHCGGFSCFGARTLGAWASVVVARGLSGCDTRA